MKYYLSALEDKEVPPTRLRAYHKISLEEFEKNITDILFGLGEFAWIVPETKDISITTSDIESIDKEIQTTVSQIIDIEDDFKTTYEISPNSIKTVKKLKYVI